MHEVLVNRLGGLSLPRESVVRLTDRPDMTLDVYRGRKTTIQKYNIFFLQCLYVVHVLFSDMYMNIHFRTVPEKFKKMFTKVIDTIRYHSLQCIDL